MHVAPKGAQNSLYNFSGLTAKFTSAYRLLRKDGFDRVIRAANISDSHFKIFFSRNGEKNARLGIVVGKKLLAGAVDRNRVKRVIRDTFRQHNIRQLHLDMVVMLRRVESREYLMHVGNLKVLFSRVESRCAEF